MSKQTKGYDLANFYHVTPQTLQRAENVIDAQKRNSYSVSGIYKAHNEIFKLREPMQTCDSCLVTRANAIKKWHDWYINQTPAAPATPGASATSITGIVSKYRFVVTGYPDDARTVFGTYLETGTPQLTDDEHAIVVQFMADTKPSDDAGDTNADPAVVPFTDEEIAALRTQYAPTDDADFIVKLQGTLDAAAASDGAIVLEGDTGAKIALLIAALTPDVPTHTVPAAIVPPTTGASAKQILLQKVNKDNYAETQGDPLYALYTPNADDATKGTVVAELTGKTLAAGTYATEDTTQVLSVQVGGKASYKAVA